MRTALQAMAAVLGGAQSLHTNSLDEAYALPSEHAVTIALRTQQVLAYESGVPNAPDPLGGSYFLEKLTLESRSRRQRLHPPHRRNGRNDRGHRGRASRRPRSPRPATDISGKWKRRAHHRGSEPVSIGRPADRVAADRRDFGARTRSEKLAALRQRRDSERRCGRRSTR